MSIQPVRTDEHGEQTHPAFAVAVVTNVSSTPGSVLFQSDLRHSRTVRLTIQRASRRRDLKRDWVHPGKHLLEVEMSMSQWAQMVSSSGDGGGTPVTLRWNDGSVPDLPYEPRIAESLRETRGAVRELLAEILEAAEDLNRLEDEKAGVRARREARSRLTGLIKNAPSNATFAAQSLSEHAESTVDRAKADIEAMAARVIERQGLEPPIRGEALVIETDQ